LIKPFTEVKNYKWDFGYTRNTVGSKFGDDYAACIELDD